MLVSREPCIEEKGHEMYSQCKQRTIFSESRLIKQYGSPYLSSAQRNGQLIDITKILCIQNS